MKLMPMKKVVTFDYKTDENQYPIEDPLQIWGDLIQTASTSYEFNEDGRVIARKHHPWFAKVKPDPKDEKYEGKSDQFDKDLKLYNILLVQKADYEAKFVPTRMDYLFDVEISGRYKDEDGNLAIAGSSCGENYKGKDTMKLYKNTVSEKYKLHKVRCTRQNCPVCFRLHASIRGQSVASKLWGVRKLNNLRLRHQAINYRTRLIPGDWDSVHDLELKFKKIMGDYHATDTDGELSYTLTIHPYSAVKTCNRCGADVRGISRVKVCECGCTSFRNARWVTGWHWHLITNFYTHQYMGFNQAMADEGFQMQNLCQNRTKYPSGHIDDEATLSRVLAYEFGHAAYTPFKARDVCRFLGGFHHGKYHTEIEERDVLQVDPDGSYYIRVDILEQFVKDLKYQITTTDTPVLTDNGEYIYYSNKIKYYAKFERKSEEGLKRQYSFSGSKTRIKKKIPKYDLTMPRRNLAIKFRHADKDYDPDLIPEIPLSIDKIPTIPELCAMLNKQNKEKWEDDDFSHILQDILQLAPSNNK